LVSDVHVPLPKNFELRKLPEEYGGGCAPGARPKDMATSCSDWMKFPVMMMARKGLPSPMVDGTAIPYILAVAKGRMLRRELIRMLAGMFAGVYLGIDDVDCIV